MLMEKMFRDFSWCPQLLSQEEDRDKRLVEETPPNNYDWSAVRAVISQSFRAGKPVSPHIFYRPLPEGGSFEHYENNPYKNFWVLTRSQFEEILLGVNRIEVRKIDGDYCLTVERRFEKGPFGDRDQKVEETIRRLIWKDCRKVFGSRVKLAVRSLYDASDTVLATVGVEHEDSVEVERFLDRLLRLHHGQDSPAPDYSKCGFCRWQECPRRPKMDTRIFDDVGIL